MAGTTHPMPPLFMVMATQNPIEQEGTYPLPEAQMDRFLMHVLIDYPPVEDEVEVIRLVRGEEIAARGARRRDRDARADPAAGGVRCARRDRRRSMSPTRWSATWPTWSTRRAPRRLRRRSGALDRDRRQPARLAGARQMRPRPRLAAGARLCRPRGRARHRARRVAPPSDAQLRGPGRRRAADEVIAELIAQVALP